MTDLAKLVVRLEAQNGQYIRELSKANKKLDKFGKDTKKSIKKVGESFDGLGVSATGLLGPLLSIVSVSAGLGKLVSVSREFDVLNAQLITATGSAEGATTAFRAIQDFAAKTPFDLQTTTKAFTQLVNLGLTPSERAMTSYGDTASAMGKDIGQLVEAVADAATGEFERLKEFGIKTRSEGDKVSFTFRGLTTTVGKNAKEIEEFLIGLGENNFAGAMSERMATLDGAISNLGDSWDKLFLSVSQQGANSFMSDAVRQATAAVEELEAMISSGQLQTGIEAIAGKFSGFGEDVAYTLDFVGNLLNEAYKDWAGDSVELGEALTEAFVNMPENVRAFIQIMTTELLAFIDRAGAYGREIGDALKFWDGDTFDIDKALERTELARNASLAAIYEENKAAIESSSEQLEAATTLREEYDAMIATRKAATEGQDILEQFKAAGADEEDAPTLSKKELGNLERVRQSLLTEEETLQESYIKRQEIIDNAHLAGQVSDEKYRELLLKNSKKYFTDEAALAAKQKAVTLSNYEELFDGLAGVAESAKGKQSGIYRALFAVSKSFAIAESIVAIQTGIANASKLSFPANLAAMASVVSATTGIISTIKGTKMDSYEGGGFTGAGGRFGGMDGKGGFLAMLHPDETVIDNRLQSGSEQSAVNINFTVNAMDAQSFQGAMVENRNIIESIIIDAHNRLGVRSAIG